MNNDEMPNTPDQDTAPIEGELINGPTDGLERRALEKVMEDSFFRYSMSVIIDRALPDVRDGLKPVHRRILHSMNVNGTTNIVGSITHKVNEHFIIKGQPFPTKLYVTDCGLDDVILGLPWLLQYNPSIDWINGQICFNPQYLRAEQKLWEY